MHFTISTLITTLFLLTSSAQQSLHVYPFEADDWYTGIHDDPINPWYEGHIVSFNISRIGAAEYECRIEWHGCEPLTCYTPCEGSGKPQYWARVTPGVKGMIAKDISIDILRSYAYRRSSVVLHNATFALQETAAAGGVEEKDGELCYQCESSWRRGVTTEWCSLKNEMGVNVEMSVFGYGLHPGSDDVVGAVCEYDAVSGWFDPRGGP